jgi:hypothetical protein
MFPDPPLAAVPAREGIGSAGNNEIWFLDTGMQACT